MAQSEIEHVLANWIAQAMSPIGRLSEGVVPSEWVAKQFVSWWRAQAEDSLGTAECAAVRLRQEVARAGGWETLGDAMEELTHLQDALADLRNDLGFIEPLSEGDSTIR